MQNQPLGKRPNEGFFLGLQEAEIEKYQGFAVFVIRSLGYCDLQS